MNVSLVLMTRLYVLLLPNSLPNIFDDLRKNLSAKQIRTLKILFSSIPFSKSLKSTWIKLVRRASTK